MLSIISPNSYLQNQRETRFSRFYRKYLSKLSNLYTYFFCLFLLWLILKRNSNIVVLQIVWINEVINVIASVMVLSIICSTFKAESVNIWQQIINFIFFYQPGWQVKEKDIHACYLIESDVSILLSARMQQLIITAMSSCKRDAFVQFTCY